MREIMALDGDSGIWSETTSSLDEEHSNSERSD